MVANSQLKNIMSKVSVVNVSNTFDENRMADYFVSSELTANGQTDVKFNKRQPASIGHFILIVGAIGVALFLMKKQSEEF